MIRIDKKVHIKIEIRVLLLIKRIERLEIIKAIALNYISIWRESWIIVRLHYIMNLIIFISNVLILFDFFVWVWNNLYIIFWVINPCDWEQFLFYVFWVFNLNMVKHLGEINDVAVEAGLMDLFFMHLTFNMLSYMKLYF